MWRLKMVLCLIVVSPRYAKEHRHPSHAQCGHGAGEGLALQKCFCI